VGGTHVLVRDFLAESGCCNCQCFFCFVFVAILSQFGDFLFVFEKIMKGNLFF
jgi:hypothetical protein